MKPSADTALSTWQGDLLRVPVPKTRDPFINTPLIFLGADAQGEERFWISTWNACVGCLGALVTSSGEAQIYRFGSNRHGGFYSAVSEDADTLWLCGNLSRIVRLTLSTGEFEEYATGAPEALVFQGMALDKVTGKLFAAAFTRKETTAFSFDIRSGESVKVYKDICPERYTAFTFCDGDGSHSFVVHTPGLGLLRWNPATEATEYHRLIEHADAGSESSVTAFRLISDEAGRWYLPGYGWYNPATRAITTGGPRPSREMTWIARHGDLVWGSDSSSVGASICLWNLDTGAISDVCMIRDSSAQGMNITKDGKVVAVNIYGEFFRFDGVTGALEFSRRLPTDSYGEVDCLCRIYGKRLLGTPFISQRFWEVNLRTKEGFDCGRAAPGAGEILRTWHIGTKVYMAAYSGGELVEYDPAVHPHFPENPRVVADPPGGMRPVAGADDGRNIYYSCSTVYGTLGSVVTRYDTATGETTYRSSPMPDQQIRSLWYDRNTRSLLCGSTAQADCQSCPPSSDRCYFARLNADTFEATELHPAPEGTEIACILGNMGEGRYLCKCEGSALQKARWFVLDGANMVVPPLEEMLEFPEGMDCILPTDIGGHFVLRFGTRLELWDLRLQLCTKRLCDDYHGYDFRVLGDSLCIMYPTEIAILDGCLAKPIQ